METKFLKDAFFAGMTANAFKLGTVLSVGCDVALYSSAGKRLWP